MKKKPDKQKRGKFTLEPCVIFSWASSRKFMWGCQGFSTRWKWPTLSHGDVHFLSEKKAWLMEEVFWPESSYILCKSIFVFPFELPYSRVAQSVNGPVLCMEYPMITFNGFTYRIYKRRKNTHYSQSEKPFLIGRSNPFEVRPLFTFQWTVNSDERQWTFGWTKGLNSFLDGAVAGREWDPTISHGCWTTGISWTIWRAVFQVTYSWLQSDSVLRLGP